MSELDNSALFEKDTILCYEELFNAVKKAEPWLRGFEKTLASSLSADTRSHDIDRIPRRDINGVLTALKRCEAKRKK